MGLLTTLLEMPRAWFRGHTGDGGNELFLDAKPDTRDPVKVRQGTFDPGNYFGALSGDFLSGNPDEPRRAEKVLVGLLPDDDSAVRHWIEDGMPGGVFQVATQKAGTDDDAGMIRGLRISARYAEVYGVRLATRHDDGRVEWHVGGGGGSGVAHELRSKNGRFVMPLQETDGNFVIYDTTKGPVGDPEAAIWDAASGRWRA